MYNKNKRDIQSEFGKLYFGGDSPYHNPFSPKSYLKNLIEHINNRMYTCTISRVIVLDYAPSKSYPGSEVLMW